MKLNQKLCAISCRRISYNANDWAAKLHQHVDIACTVESILNMTMGLKWKKLQRVRKIRFPLFSLSHCSVFEKVVRCIFSFLSLDWQTHVYTHKANSLVDSLSTEEHTGKNRTRNTFGIVKNRNGKKIEEENVLVENGKKPLDERMQSCWNVKFIERIEFRKKNRN